MQALRCRCTGTRWSNEGGNCSFTHQQGDSGWVVVVVHAIAQALGLPHSGQRVGSSVGSGVEVDVVMTARFGARRWAPSCYKLIGAMQMPLSPVFQSNSTGDNACSVT
jgi:hypothetical protein